MVVNNKKMKWWQFRGNIFHIILHHFTWHFEMEFCNDSMDDKSHSLLFWKHHSVHQLSYVPTPSSPSISHKHRFDRWIHFDRFWWVWDDMWREWFRFLFVSWMWCRHFWDDVSDLMSWRGWKWVLLGSVHHLFFYVRWVFWWSWISWRWRWEWWHVYRLECLRSWEELGWWEELCWCDDGRNWEDGMMEWWEELRIKFCCFLYCIEFWGDGYLLVIWCLDCLGFVSLFGVNISARLLCRFCVEVCVYFV